MRQMLTGESLQPVRIATPPSGPRTLLVRLRSTAEPSGATQAEKGAWADGLVSDGWSVLDLGCASDDDVAAAIGDALGQLHDVSSAAGGPQLIVLAEHGLACTAARALVALDRRKAAAPACGLVTIDAFAEAAFPAVAEQLAHQPGVAALWTVTRGEPVVRAATFAHHAALQSQRHDSRYLVVPKTSGGLSTLDADRQSAFGRELRWLLAPVNSRN